MNVSKRGVEICTRFSFNSPITLEMMPRLQYKLQGLNDEICYSCPVVGLVG